MMSAVKRKDDVGEITCGPLSVTITWKIRNYFELPQEVDYCLESSSFHFHNSTWHLRLYPNGETKENSFECVALYLVCKFSNVSEQKMQYNIGIVKRNGSRVPDKSLDYTFRHNDETAGWPRLIYKTTLNQQKNEMLPEGILTLFCSMTVSTCEDMQAAARTDIPPSGKILMQDFKNLLFSGEAADVTLSVKEKEYKAHRAVLVARSAVFAAMMRHDWKEKSSEVIHVEDCDPSAFQIFLTYLYSGDVEHFSVETIFSLHYIADKYQIADLKERCVQFMIDNLSVDIFCDILSILLRENESEHMERAIAFFAKNLKSILVTTKWLSFIADNLTEANEVLVKAVDYKTESQ